MKVYRYTKKQANPNPNQKDRISHPHFQNFKSKQSEEGDNKYLKNSSENFALPWISEALLK